MADGLYSDEVPKKLEYLIQNTPIGPIFIILYSSKLALILLEAQEGL